MPSTTEQTPQVADARPYPGHEIRVGSTDRDSVLAIQSVLVDKGFGPLGVDGSFGPLTEGAVKRFQASAQDQNGGALAVDGRVGPLTWGALFGAATVPVEPGLPQIAPLVLSASSRGLLRTAVEQGAHEPPIWVPVPFRGLTVMVGAHALRANVGRRLLRLPVSYQDVIAICNQLAWVPPIAELSDAIWNASTVRIDFVPQSASIMTTLAAVHGMNTKMDAQLSTARWSELTATEGKDWIVSARNLLPSRGNPPEKGVANYGWHHPDGTMVQPRRSDGEAAWHDSYHWDYSQTLRPIQRMARRADGTEVNLLTVYAEGGIPEGALAPFR